MPAELEIVLEDRRDSACIEAFDIARSVFARVTSSITVIDRPMDAGELESLVLASPSQPLRDRGVHDRGIVDLHEFIAAQHVARQEHNIPDSRKTMTIITSRRSTVVDDRHRRVVLGPKGYSAVSRSEGVVAALEITQSLITPRQRKMAGLLIAYTLVHEEQVIFSVKHQLVEAEA